MHTIFDCYFRRSPNKHSSLPENVWPPVKIHIFIDSCSHISIFCEIWLSNIFLSMYEFGSNGTFSSWYTLSTGNIWVFDWWLRYTASFSYLWRLFTTPSEIGNPSTQAYFKFMIKIVTYLWNITYTYKR